MMSEDVTVSYNYLCRKVSQLSAQVAERNATIAAQAQHIAELEAGTPAPAGVPRQVAATIRMYLEGEKVRLEILQKQDDWIGRRQTIAYIEAALTWLDTLRAGQYEPIEGHIVMVISGEIQDVQAHSISGLPLPENVAVCKNKL